MKALGRVARIAAADCATKPVVGTLPIEPNEITSRGRVIRTEGVAFGFATEHEHTLHLLDQVWQGHVEPTAPESPRIVIGAAAGHRGRYVDPENEWQLLAFDYAPFTLIKQSLRWEYARQSVTSGLVPLHGVIVEAGGRRVAMSARGQSGKSYLADRWLATDHEARVLVDDWSLVEASTMTIRRAGDASLHVRGSAFERESAQLHGAEPVAAELCEEDERHNESRFLVRRDRLHRFQHDESPRTLDALVFIREPFGDRFGVDDSAGAVRDAFAAEASTFWDDSLIGLPGYVVEHLRAAWTALLSRTRVVVMQGHRGADADAVVLALREALEG